MRCRSRAGRRGRGCTLAVIRVHDGLADIHRRSRPQHFSLRPRVGNIHDQAVSILLRVLLDDGGQFGQNLLYDLVLLAVVVVLRVLGRALEGLLLALDALDQRRAGVVVHLGALRVQLLFQVVDFLVQALQLGLLGLEFFLQRVKVPLSLIGGQDDGLHVDGADFDAGGGRRRGGGGGAARLRQSSHGQQGGRQNEAEKLAFHWVVFVLLGRTSSETGSLSER